MVSTTSEARVLSLQIRQGSFVYFEIAMTNIDVLMVNPTSIPEHSEFTKELDKHITEIATAKEKIAVLEDDLAYLGKEH